MIPWYRSWPLKPPKDRVHVVDNLPKLKVHRYDYDSILQWPEHNLVMVEWDIAVSREDVCAFTEACAATPSSVHVAPYRIYPASSGLSEPVYVHRVGSPEPQSRWITDGEPLADYVGFGMIYLPLRIVQRFKREYSVAHGARFTDTGFSLWHHENVGPIPVHWNVRPVHLHY